ncbi:MAG: PQQ-binding-like beta-propeller repeat protein [Pirellulales bacterium]|nr:PQQ-binding-like beta-propeller repeat protein [Pirellulales bacterium]
MPCCLHSRLFLAIAVLLSFSLCAGTASAQPKAAAPTTPATQKAPAAKSAATPNVPAKSIPAQGIPATKLVPATKIAPAKGQFSAQYQVQPGDWNQWGGSPGRNNAPEASNLPTEWEITMDPSTGKFVPEKSKNIKWAVPLGSQTYGNTVVANGQVYVGTNNGAAYLKRYPATVDLGVLLCFDEATGKFLWQDSSEKLPTGRVHDWPLMGICCSPLIDGERLWYVTSRGEVKCLDTRGFHDDENDGSVKDEKFTAKDEADVIWNFNMMKQLGISQHNMCSCSVTIAGDYLFVLTGNGVDEGHTNLPAPKATSFLVLNKNNGQVIWADNTPGENVLHGQWSSPAFAEIGGIPQLVFGAGDGWVYSFDARGENGKAKLLWKFDCNPKTAKYTLQGADRNHIIGTPVIYDGLVYVAVGEDPEHGEGQGHLWCIDPLKKTDGSDVSPELVFNTADPQTPIPHKRNQACEKEKGDFTRANPNSAALWEYASHDANNDGKLDFEEKMHRTIGTVAISGDLLFVVDFSGLVHCLDRQTGVPHWTHDMLAVSWGSPLIADGKMYCGDEDGDITIFTVGKEKDVLGEINMGSAVYSTPIVANGVLYISSKNYLFAIAEPK